MKSNLCIVLVMAFLMLSGKQSLAAVYNLTPTDDTWVYSYAPDTNYGTDNGFATDIQYMSPRAYSFLKFTIPTLGIGEVITSASLNLYQFTGAGYGEGPTAIGLYSNNDWSESTLTWNNTSGSPVLALATNSNGHSYVGWSNWSFNWNSNIGNTFTLYIGENSSGDQVHWWYSKEASDTAVRPYLQITTTGAPVPIPSAFLLLGSGLAGLAAIKRRFFTS